MTFEILGAIVPDDDVSVYEWCGIQHTSPTAVKEFLKTANGGKIDINISSGGGDVFAGSEIYEALRQYEGECEMHITGIAASAASFIAMARQSDIAPTAMLMVHNVSCISNGDYHVMDKSSETLQSANDAIASAYCLKTGKDKTEILQMMDAETWLTAEQAVNMGLVDAVSEPQYELVAGYNSGILPPETVSKLKARLQNDLSLEKIKVKVKHKRRVSQ